MSYTAAELEEVKAQIQSALAGGRLTAWQSRFLTDHQNRIDRYGRGVRLSDRQRAKLKKILSGSASRRRISNPPPVQFGAHRRPRFGRFLMREGRWFARRLGRDAVLLGGLFMGLLIYSFVEKAPWPDVGHFFQAEPQQQTSRSITADHVRITDGDTIRLVGDPKGMRLVGFNTPETIEPRCAAERALGIRAKERLKQLVSSAKLDLERVFCACAPGMEGSDACNYGRSCGRLRVNGSDVGAILISEGLAVPFECGANSCPPTPRPWCG